MFAGFYRFALIKNLNSLRNIYTDVLLTGFHTFFIVQVGRICWNITTIWTFPFIKKALHPVYFAAVCFCFEKISHCSACALIGPFIFHGPNVSSCTWDKVISLNSLSTLSYEYSSQRGHLSPEHLCTEHLYTEHLCPKMHADTNFTNFSNFRYALESNMASNFEIGTITETCLLQVAPAHMVWYTDCLLITNCMLQKTLISHSQC